MTHADINDLETRDYVFKVGDRVKGIQARYDKNTDALIFSRGVFDYVWKLLNEALSQESCDVFDKYGNYKYPSDVELAEPNTATSMPCEDAISREAEIKKLKEQPAKVFIDKTDYQRGYIDGVNQMVKELKAEQKSGKWIPIPYKLDCETDAECSLCHEQFIDAMNYNFCPNCGCRMVEPQESEDKG